MNTVKRDVSSVEACYKLSSILFFRSSHSFQNARLTGFRMFQQLTLNTITKCTLVDQYLSGHDDNQNSLYQYICRNGKMPVISAGHLFYFIDQISDQLDIKSDDTSRTE